MTPSSIKQATAAAAAGGTLVLLLVISAGCAPKVQTRAEAEKSFLAPTNLDKLTPAARAHLPGGAKFQPTKKP